MKFSNICLTGCSLTAVPADDTKQWYLINGLINVNTAVLHLKITNAAVNTHG